MASAHISCGHDWKIFLKHDSPETVFVLDPPWTDVLQSNMRYQKKAPITAQEVVQRTRNLKAGVAIVYKDTSETRRVLCRKPFRCHKIHKNFFGKPFTQLLAVKQPRGGSRQLHEKLTDISLTFRLS